MKYVIYARKSSEDSKRQALSISAQIDAMRSVAERDQLEIVKVFQESKSAKYPGREIFNEMMLFIEQGKADGILCWKMDRLARNPIDEGKIKYFLEAGVIKMIKTPDREFDSQENSVITGIEFSMATQYSRNLSKDVKRGNRKKLEMGWWPSSAPFGYLNAHGEKPIILDPERAPLLRFAFRRYAEGNISIKALNTILYEKGLRTKYGKRLTVSALHHKLQNPFYYGLMVRNYETFQGKHEPLITKELFDQVQEVRTGGSKSRGYKHFFLYRGFLSCEKCGCRLTADKKKGFTYYYCTNGKGICDNHKKYMRSETVDQEIVDRLDALRFPVPVIDLMYDAAMKRRGMDHESEKQAKERLKRVLEECLKAQDKLFADHNTGKVPEIIYERKMKELAKEQEHLEQQIRQKVSTDQTTFERTKKEFLYANKAKKEFMRGNEMQKRKLLEKLLSNASFDDQKVSQIQYKKAYHLMANAPKKAKIDALLGR